jgi:hypothetical protein
VRNPSPPGACGRRPGRAHTGNQVVAFALVGDKLERLVDPGPNAILPGQHYVSIAIEEVRVHAGRLPRPLALVLKVNGALPQGDEFNAVLGTTRKEDNDGFFKYNRTAIISAFAYKGKPLAVEVALAPCTEEWAQQIDKAKKEWGEVREVDPNAYVRHPVDAAHLGVDGSDWLRVAFGTKEDRNSLPLAAGRYVVFAHPNANEIAAKVTFDDRGLIWAGKDEVVKGVSFATFLVNRRRRGPRRDTPLEQAIKAVQGALEAGRLVDAKNGLQKLPEMIAQDPHITEPERELNRAFIAIYQLRIDRREAKQANDKATFVAKSEELIKTATELKKKFADMIEPVERNQLDFSLRRWTREKDE